MFSSPPQALLFSILLTTLTASPVIAQSETCALLTHSGEGLSGESLDTAEAQVRQTLSATDRQVMDARSVTRALREAGEAPCGESACVTSFLTATGAQMAVSVMVHAEAGSNTPFRVSVSLTDSAGNRVNAALRIEGGDVSQAAELAAHDALARWADRSGIPFRVSGSPAGATVTVDGEAFGILPNAEGRLSTGPHLVAVGRDGYLTFTRRVVVGAESGDTLQVSLRPRPGGSPDAGEEDPDLSAEAASPWTSRRIVGVSLASAGTLGAVGLLLAGAMGTECIEENSAGCLVTREPGGAHYALVGVAAAVAATGFVLWIIPPGTEGDEPDASLSVHPTGVDLQVSF